MKTTNQLEIERLFAIVQQREADLALAKFELNKAKQREWTPIPKADLHRLLKERGPLRVLTPSDWEGYLWEFASNAEAGEARVNIGGYWDNDRFRGHDTVYIPVHP